MASVSKPAQPTNPPEWGQAGKSAPSCWAYIVRGSIVLLAVMLAACRQAPSALIPEEDDPEFRRGRQFLRQDRKREALEAFLGVIERRPNAPESHFEAAELFLTHLEDPISAIYHYQRYKQYRRDTEKARRVDQRIETAKKEFARTLPGNPLRSDIERLDLLARLEQLQAENQQLKREVTELRGALARAGVAAPAGFAAPVRPAEPVPAPAVQPQVAAPVTRAAPTQPTRITTYVVQPGDTLYKISQSVYGTPARWGEIFEANRDRIPNQNSLRVGTELRIP